jgi:hypothetical protein
LPTMPGLKYGQSDWQAYSRVNSTFNKVNTLRAVMLKGENKMKDRGPKCC